MVDSGSYLKAVLGAAGYEHETECKALVEAIVGSSTDRLVPLIAGLDRPDLTDDEFARYVASPDLTEMLAEAGRLASQASSGQVRVSWRHALAACLKQLPAQQAIWTERLSTETSSDAVFSQIRSTLTDILTDTGSPDDYSTVWDHELEAVQPHPDLRLPEPERRSDTHYVGDDPVKTLTEDRLGLANEVRALAEVICLREPGPPLAIGLFGDWGSGKSTYMNPIEAAIDELTRRTTSDQEARALFVEGVVHIKFNAWHYNDADLWSSLTSEFFRQLRVGGHAGRGLDDYSALVRQVAERVATAEAAADEESKNLESERSAASDLRKQLAELDRQDAALPAETLLTTARAEVALLPEKDKEQLCGRCQSKIEYYARMPDSNFATIDFSRFFGPDLGGSTAISGIQNFALTMPDGILALPPAVTEPARQPLRRRCEWGGTAPKKERYAAHQGLRFGVRRRFGYRAHARPVSAILQ